LRDAYAFDTYLRHIHCDRHSSNRRGPNCTSPRSDTAPTRRSPAESHSDHRHNRACRRTRAQCPAHRNRAEQSRAEQGKPKSIDHSAHRASYARDGQTAEGATYVLRRCADAVRSAGQANARVGRRHFAKDPRIAVRALALHCANACAAVLTLTLTLRPIERGRTVACVIVGALCTGAAVFTRIGCALPNGHHK
jgi:hypothetical protein